MTILEIIVVTAISTFIMVVTYSMIVTGHQIVILQSASLDIQHELLNIMTVMKRDLQGSYYVAFVSSSPDSIELKCEIVKDIEGVRYLWTNTGVGANTILRLHYASGEPPVTQTLARDITSFAAVLNEYAPGQAEVSLQYKIEKPDLLDHVSQMVMVQKIKLRNNVEVVITDQ